MAGELEKSAEKVTRAILGELTRIEKINLVLLALKVGGFNDAIEADGQFGIQGKKGLGKLLATPLGKNPEGVNLMIFTFRILGLNDSLEVGGWVGDETRKAVENFRQFLKEES